MGLILSGQARAHPFAIGQAFGAGVKHRTASLVAEWHCGQGLGGRVLLAPPGRLPGRDSWGGPGRVAALEAAHLGVDLGVSG